MTARLPDIDWVDERLKAWARYFKDRHHFQSCGSGEKLFRAASEDFAREGWGEPSPPEVKPLLDLPSVLQTHSAIQLIPKSQRWAVTYAYCYPSLARHMVLKLMRKYTGRRWRWADYLREVEVARMRVASYLLVTTRYAA